MSTANPSPDWQIGELFEHIGRDRLLEGNTWQAIGGDVLDKMATGQLLSWGRSKGAGQRPLEPIIHTFWHSAALTYSFLAPDHDQAEHARSTNVLANEVFYSDLRVNKAQALCFWP